jgi:putative transposase
MNEIIENERALGRARPPDEPPQRKPLGHTVPSWVKAGSVFFITICAARRGRDDLTRDDIALKLIQTVRHLHVKGDWFARLFLVMPDHVHGLFSFPATTSLADRISSWKAYTAKNLNVQWQDRFFDHRLRSDESLEEKAAYIRRNPVRAELVKAPELWPFVFDAFADDGSSGTPRPTS